MRAVISVGGLLLVLGAGYFIVRGSLGGGSGQRPPTEQIDVVGINQQLIAIGQAERQYLATHGTYATLDELAREDLLPGGTQSRGYTMTATTSGSDRFTITATPTDLNKTGWPTLEISENMQVTER